MEVRYALVRTLNQEAATMARQRFAGCFITMLSVMVWLLGSGTATADVSPPGCTANNAGLNAAKSANAINNGDTVTYSITFHNSAVTTSCDVTDAVITFTCPGADGNADGTVFALA